MHDFYHFYQFCPRCSQPLGRAILFGRQRPHCPACDFIFFQNPKVAVAVLVAERDRVLLVKRAVAPQIGLWSLPAGFMDFDEMPPAAARREVEEESGIRVEITGLLEIFPMPQGGGIVITYTARPLNDHAVQPGDDVSDAAWFTPATIPVELAFESTVTVLARWRDSVREQAA